MKSLVYVFITILLLSGCAGFSNKMLKGNNTTLNENDLVKLEGHYELFPDSSYDKKGHLKIIESYDSKARNNLNCFIKSTEVKYSYSERYLVEIKVINQNRLKFITQKNNIKIDSSELTGKLKNGLFYLENKYLKRNGIPYLFGGYTHHKTRIGLAGDEGLLVNYAYDNSGAILFMFWAGSSYNLGYHYKRIESNE